MPGGTTFYAFPYKNDAVDEGRTVNSFSRHGAALEFSVFFDADFDFAKGGKLPGLVGGRTNGRGCAGGAAAEDCFSARLNFKGDGNGQLYLYVPGPEGYQEADFCTFFPACNDGEGEGGGDGENSGPVAGAPPPPAAPPPPPFRRVYPCNYCHPTYGVGLGRGAWRWTRGAWNTVRLTMRLNTPGLRDGAVRVEHNGVTVVQYDKMNWRLTERVAIEGARAAPVAAHPAGRGSARSRSLLPSPPAPHPPPRPPRPPRPRLHHLLRRPSHLAQDAVGALPRH